MNFTKVYDPATRKQVPVDALSQFYVKTLDIFDDIKNIEKFVNCIFSEIPYERINRIYNEAFVILANGSYSTGRTDVLEIGNNVNKFRYFIESALSFKKTTSKSIIDVFELRELSFLDGVAIPQTSCVVFLDTLIEFEFDISIMPEEAFKQYKAFYGERLSTQLCKMNISTQLLFL